LLILVHNVMTTCLTRPTITAEQIVICNSCIHISAKKLWCCKWGFQVKEKTRIITREKKVIQPPTLSQMISNFTGAMIRWAKSGLKTVDQIEYVRRISICSQCSGGWRCPHCGCVIKAKAALATEKCPELKW